MGKATIISHLGDGKYNVTLNLDASRIKNLISSLETKITEWTALIASLEEEIENGTGFQLLLWDRLNKAKLSKASFEKRKEYYEDLIEDYEEPTAEIWCGDKTEDLITGLEVGTIEVPGERGDVYLQPGYDSNALYDADRDGLLQPTWASLPSTVFYNWAMLPGWQRWTPTFRTGTISNIDHDANTCTVTLDEANSSVQKQALDINPTSGDTGIAVLADVPIEYMACNSGAFANDDEVVVKFTNQSWETPVVIGFKENPTACYLWLEPWGDTLTENHAWNYYHVLNTSPFSMCYSLGCDGEGELDGGFLKWNYTPNGSGNAGINLRWVSEYYSPSTESSIEGAISIGWSMDGGLDILGTDGNVSIILFWGDGDGNPNGESVHLFIQAGSDFYDGGDFDNPCSDSSPYYDLSGLSGILDGSNFEYDLTNICNYETEIVRITVNVLIPNGSTLNLDFDYLKFM